MPRIRFANENLCSQRRLNFSSLYCLNIPRFVVLWFPMSKSMVEPTVDIPGFSLPFIILWVTFVKINMSHIRANSWDRQPIPNTYLRNGTFPANYKLRLTFRTCQKIKLFFYRSSFYLSLQRFQINLFVFRERLAKARPTEKETLFLFQYFIVNYLFADRMEWGR